MICSQCRNACGAERGLRERGGRCDSTWLPTISRASLHMWEEPAISGKRGSGTVFFSGCALSCVFCQNAAISRKRAGRTLTYAQLADVFKKLEDAGAHNINLVNPTHYAHAVIAALDIYRPKIPIIYNTGGYDGLGALRALKGYVDVYLPDFKYSDDELGLKYSKAPGLSRAAEESIAEMLSQTGEARFDGEGMILGGTVIRHLILPGHVKNTLGVLNIIKRKFPGAVLSIMSQYTPMPGVPDELSRKITARELERVTNYLFKHDMPLGWVQDRSSADKGYIPSFGREGEIVMDV